MQELVQRIAKAVEETAAEVVVTETEKECETLIELKVAPSDMGKVIGKQGRIAKAIRSVVKAAASKEEKKVVVDIQQPLQAVVWHMQAAAFFNRSGLRAKNKLKSKRSGLKAREPV